MSGMGSVTPEGSMEGSVEESSMETDIPSDMYLMSQAYPPPLPQFATSLGFSMLPQQPPIKRGPGRPRKDGLSPIARRGRGMRGRGAAIRRRSAQLFQDMDDLGSPPRPASLDSMSMPDPHGHMSPQPFSPLPSMGMLGRSPSAGSLGGLRDSMESDDLPGSSLEKMASEESLPSVSSDTSGSSYPGKMCSFCNCGERSLLGQGELGRYDPTVGFNPFKKPLCRRQSGEGDDKSPLGEKSPKPLTWRRARGPPRPGRDRSKSPRRPPYGEGGCEEVVDELTLVGMGEDVEAQHVFEKTGHTMAHHCCAAWSEGVIQTEEYQLLYVDKAVFTGLSQKCSFCHRYGATIQCRAPKCNRIFHYPCASGGGCFQDIKTLSLLCPEHTDQAETIAGTEALCVVCDRTGEMSEQLFCTSCGHHYHGNCLDPPVEVNPIVRAGWQCPECKICQTCRQPGDDNKMLVCDTCDKGYHTFCLRPVMTTIPKNGWKCKNCRVCGDCGSRTPGSGPSSRWHLNYSVCDSCYQQRNKGLSCPLCGKAYRHFTQKSMAQCNMCKKYVHGECDESIEQLRAKMGRESIDAHYICLLCKNRGSAPPDMPITEIMSSPSTTDESHLQDIESFNIFKHIKQGPPGDPDPGSSVRTEDPDDLLPPTQFAEDSISSMDIDLAALENGVVQQLGSPSGSMIQGSGYHQSNSASSSPRPVGPGKGKPPMGSIGKKRITVGRPRGRGMGVSVGKKSQRRPAVPVGEKKRGRKPSHKLGQGRGEGSMSSGLARNNDDEDPHSTIIITHSKDDFSLKQDMCMSCGSLGTGEESKLIVCTQCGQCYHPYCANVKPSKVVLQKGWRCLDCTVCEGCGKPHDEPRLILCDECDISYHTYCLDPPLDHVPKGTWKCKWCVSCKTCGVTTPGVGCQWQNNYSQCGPCASLIVCPVCTQHYLEDQLIIQCAHCERWLHAGCDQIRSEDDAERATDFGYNCIFCRPVTGATGPLPPLPPVTEPERALTPPPMPSPPPPITRMYARQYKMDGVWVSECGLNQIKALACKFSERRGRGGMRGRGRGRRADIMGRTPSTDTNEDDKDDDKDMFNYKDDTEDGEISPMEKLSPGGARMSVDSSAEKKPRKQRLRVGTGVGGFIARPRIRGMLYKQRSMVGLLKAGGEPPPQISIEMAKAMVNEGKYTEMEEDKHDAELAASFGVKKRKRPKKRYSLEECYPPYLQEAFFGKVLLDHNKPEMVGPGHMEDSLLSPAKTPVGSSAPSTPAVQAGSNEGYGFPNSSSSPKQSVPQVQNDPLPSTSEQPHQDQQVKDHLDDLESILNADILDEDDMIKMLDQDSADDIGEDITSRGAPGGDNKDNIDSMLTQNIGDDVLGMLDQKTMQDIITLMGPDHSMANSTSAPAASASEQSLPSSGGQTGAQTAAQTQLGQAQLQTQTQLSQGQLPGPGQLPRGHMPGQPQLSQLPPHPPLPGQHPGQAVPRPVHPPPQPGQPPHHMPIPGQHLPGQQGIPRQGLHIPGLAGHPQAQGHPASHMPPGHTAQSHPMHLQGQMGRPAILRLPSQPLPSPEEPPHYNINPTSTSGGTLRDISRIAVPDAQVWQRLDPDLAPSQDEETEVLSWNKKNLQKWEKDEPFGHMATISPVLYANINHADLKEQYPDWNERAKQISKIWRKVPQDQRAPFLAKARENRATLRAQKVARGQGKRRSTDKESPVGVMPPPIMPPPPKPNEDIKSEDINSPSSTNPAATTNPMDSKPGTPSDDTPLTPGTPGHSGPSTPVSQDGSEGGKVTQDAISMPPPPTPPTSSAYPRITGEDPYNKPPGTPHPSGFPFPRQQVPRPQTTSPNDPFIKPSLPAMSRADPFSPGPRPPTSESFAGMQQQVPRPPTDPYSSQPATPRPQDPYSMQPSTPRPMTSDPYAMQPGTPRPPPTDTFVSRESLRGMDPFSMEFAQRGIRPTQPNDPFQRGAQYRPRLPTPFSAANRPTTLGGDHMSQAGPEHRFPRPPPPHMDPFSPDSEMAELQDMIGGQGQINETDPAKIAERQQLRELLAKQTIERQNRKKMEEKERLIRDGVMSTGNESSVAPQQQMPLRHWPGEGPPPAGFQSGGHYFGEGERLPPAYGVRGPHMPPVGDGWPDGRPHMISRPHHLGIRPDVEQFGPRGPMGEQMRFAGMRHPSAPHQPGFPPAGQFPPQFAQRPQMMDMRAQMFQESLRKQQQQGQGQISMEPFNPMMRHVTPGQQHPIHHVRLQHPQAAMRVRMMMQQRPQMQGQPNAPPYSTGAQFTPTGQSYPSQGFPYGTQTSTSGVPGQEKQEEDKELEDLIADGSFNLLEYADPELDLVEEQDKSIFDEHLGLTKKTIPSTSTTPTTPSASAPTTPQKSVSSAPNTPASKTGSPENKDDDKSADQEKEVAQMDGHNDEATHLDGQCDSESEDDADEADLEVASILYQHTLLVECMSPYSTCSNVSNLTDDIPQYDGAYDNNFTIPQFDGAGDENGEQAGPQNTEETQVEQRQEEAMATSATDKQDVPVPTLATETMPAISSQVAPPVLSQPAPAVSTPTVSNPATSSAVSLPAASTPVAPPMPAESHSTEAVAQSPASSPAVSSQAESDKSPLFATDSTEVQMTMASSLPASAQLIAAAQRSNPQGQVTLPTLSVGQADISAALSIMSQKLQQSRQQVVPSQNVQQGVTQAMQSATPTTTVQPGVPMMPQPIPSGMHASQAQHISQAEAQANMAASQGGTVSQTGMPESAEHIHPAMTTSGMPTSLQSMMAAASLAGGTPISHPGVSSSHPGTQASHPGAPGIVQAINTHSGQSQAPQIHLGQSHAHSVMSQASHPGQSQAPHPGHSQATHIVQSQAHPSMTQVSHPGMMMPAASHAGITAQASQGMQQTMASQGMTVLSPQMVSQNMAQGMVSQGMTSQGMHPGIASHPGMSQAGMPAASHPGMMQGQRSMMGQQAIGNMQGRPTLMMQRMPPNQRVPFQGMQRFPQGAPPNMPMMIRMNPQARMQAAQGMHPGMHPQQGMMQQSAVHQAHPGAMHQLAKTHAALLQHQGVSHTGALQHPGQPHAQSHPGMSPRQAPSPLTIQGVISPRQSPHPGMSPRSGQSPHPSTSPHAATQARVQSPLTSHVGLPVHSPLGQSPQATPLQSPLSHPAQSPHSHPGTSPRPVQSPQGMMPGQSPRQVQSPQGMMPGQSPRQVQSPQAVLMHPGMSPRPVQSPQSVSLSHPVQSPQGNVIHSQSPQGMIPIQSPQASLPIHSPQATVANQSPQAHAIPTRSPNAAPTQSPQAVQIQSPQPAMGHPGQSPRHVQSPHSVPSSVMSPRSVASPHPGPSPGPGVMHHPVPSPHPGPSPHQSVSSPHPHSRSTTPQMSPRGQPGSQPGTPVVTAPTTPQPGVPMTVTTTQPVLSEAMLQRPEGPRMMVNRFPGMHAERTPNSTIGMLLNQGPPRPAPPYTQPGMQQRSMFPVSTQQQMYMQGQPGMPSQQRMPQQFQGMQMRPGVPGHPGQQIPGHPGQHQPGIPGHPGQHQPGMPGHPGQQIPGHPGQQMHPGQQIPGHPGQQIPGHPGQQMPGHPGQQMPGHPGQQMPGHPGQQIPGHPGQQIPGHPGQQIPGHPGQHPGMPGHPGQHPHMQPRGGLPPGMTPEQFHMIQRQRMMQAGGPGMPPRYPGHSTAMTTMNSMPAGVPVSGIPTTAIPGVPTTAGVPGTPAGPPASTTTSPAIPVSSTASTTTSAMSRPLLLDEKPLLLEDLLEEEKREQQRQAEQQMLMQKQQASKMAGIGSPPSAHPSGVTTDAGLRVDIDAARRNAGPTPTTTAAPRMPNEQPQRFGAPESIWPSGMASPREGLQSPHSSGAGTPLRFPGQPTPQLSPRTPSPFPSPSPGASHSPAMTSPSNIPPPPPRPPMPLIGNPNEPVSEVEKQQQVAYEDWLMQHSFWLAQQVKTSEGLLAKARKAKKTLATKQRQAKKNGEELAQTEQSELDKMTTDQQAAQKQLENLRKQQRQHQTLIQDYRLKQQERFGHPWPSPPTSMMQPGGTGMMGQQAGIGPGIMSPGQAPPPRMPGSQPVRLPTSVRQEYETYMQNRLRMISQPRQTMVTGAGIEQLQYSLEQILHKVRQVRITRFHGRSNEDTGVQDENNPFSESFQMREHMEKIQQQEQQRRQLQQQIEQQRLMASQLGDEDKPVPPPGGSMVQMPYMQPGGGRFPRMPLEGGQPGMRFPPGGFPPRHRFPGRFPGDVGVRPPPGAPMGMDGDPHRMLPPPYSQHQPRMPHPLIQDTTASSGDLEQPAKVKKKRRRKKKMEDYCDDLNVADPATLSSQSALFLSQTGLLTSGGPQPVIVSQPGMPTSMAESRSINSNIHHQMSMSAVPPGASPMHQLISTTKDIPPATSMSQLQKLVNMQPQVLPPDVTRGQHMDARDLDDLLKADDKDRDGLDLDPRMANQNVLLKQLLSTPKQGDGQLTPQQQQQLAQLQQQLQQQQQQLEQQQSGGSQSPTLSLNDQSLAGTEDSEDGITLTPEQQRQLAMIESMPLIRELEISQEEWATKTAEEKERIIETRISAINQQEYDRRRKELDDMKKKPLQKKRQYKKKELGLDLKENLLPQPKKRPRKASFTPPKETSLMFGQEEPHIGPVVPAPPTPDFSLDQVMQNIRSLPQLPLEEPTVSINHLQCPVFGTPANPDPEKADLKGTFGYGLAEAFQDVYNEFPFPQHRPLIPLSDPNHPKFAEAFQKSPAGGDGREGRTTQRYHITEKHHMHEDVKPLTKPSLPAISMPSPPLIQPRHELMSRGSDQSPATVISSSSPESDLKDQLKGVGPEAGLAMKGLRLITMDEGRSEDEQERECVSPHIPVLCPTPVKPTTIVKQENNIESTLEMIRKGQPNNKEELMDMLNREDLANKMANIPGLARPMQEAQSQVAVTLTLNRGAAQDIGGVISAIADLLKIAVPPTYEVSRSPSPEIPFKKANNKYQEEEINIQSLIKQKPRFCEYCKLVVQGMGVVRKITQMECLPHDAARDAEEDEFYFCGRMCLQAFNDCHSQVNKCYRPPIQVATPVTAALLALEQAEKQQKEMELRAQAAMNYDSEPSTPDKSSISHYQASLHTPTGSRRIADLISGTPPIPKMIIKKWKGNRYRKWDPSCMKAERPSQVTTEEEVGELMMRMKVTIRPRKMPKDERRCTLCLNGGDMPTDGPGRLLNMDADKWIHLNCALWSYEVYETLNGSLMNVEIACKRGLTTECVLCKKKGATINCFKPRCSNIYHLPCAQEAGIIFFQDKTLLCANHAAKQPLENELNCISVFRRVFVNRDENKQVASVAHHDEKKFIVRVGAIVFHNVGQLLPHQIGSGRFHNCEYIYPVGYKATRFYWSYRQINRRARYICKIQEKEGAPYFVIKVLEEGMEEAIHTGSSPRMAWCRILECLDKLRRENDLVKMFPGYLFGEELYGLNEPAIVRIIESLPGVELLTSYSFKFGRSPLIEPPLAINPTGCARSEPKLRTHFKRPHTLQTSGHGRSIPSTVQLIPGDFNTPYMKTFVHSKSQQYRRLKTEWRNNVYLRRSNVQGLGLFAARDLEKHTMVIEYIGELIRNEVAEYREKLYDSQNRGVYMFRIDDNTVIDATMCGGPARYINHSCAPNCVAEVVPFEKDSKIIIIAKRRISRGEELTYDYKFDFEDDQHKIPCNCGASNCRKWMN